MKIYPILLLTYVLPVLAVNHDILRMTSDFVPEIPSQYSIRGIANAQTPHRLIFNNIHQIEAASIIQTSQFGNQIELAAAPRQSPFLVERFLEFLPRLQELRTITIRDISFSNTQFQRLAEMLSRFRLLKSVAIVNSRGIRHTEILELPLQLLQSLTVYDTFLRLNISQILGRSPRLRYLSLSNNRVLGTVDFENLPRALEYIGGENIRSINWDSNNLGPANALATTRYLIDNFDPQLEAVLANRFHNLGPLIWSPDLHGGNIVAMILLRMGQAYPQSTYNLISPLIGNGTLYVLHQPILQNQTLAMIIADTLGEENPQLAYDLLLPLIGDGSRPELHIADINGLTLAMIITERMNPVNPELSNRLLSALSRSRIYLQMPHHPWVMSRS
jgi:hypothetical protein